MDREAIHAALRTRYALAASIPEGQFPYPVGRDSMVRLGYDPDRIAGLDPVLQRRYLGVGNPFSLGIPKRGWRVVDLGCGAGCDTLLAAAYTGSEGLVIGIDPCPEMLAFAGGANTSDSSRVIFVQGLCESLPIGDAWADLVISNGVLNLAVDKTAAFAEIARVLKPGGRLQAADLVRVRELPAELRNDKFAWTN